MNPLDDNQHAADSPEEDPGHEHEGEAWSISFQVPPPKRKQSPEEEDRQVIQRFLAEVEAKAEHDESLVKHLNHYRRMQEDEDYANRFRRLEAEEDDLQPEEYDERRRQLLGDDYLGADESMECVRKQWDENLAELAQQVPSAPHLHEPATPIQIPGDHRPRSSWEWSLDPAASWQHSVPGLLPGTVVAILLALAAAALYAFVSPTLGVVVGVLAALNVIVAVNHWLRLGESLRC